MEVKAPKMPSATRTETNCNARSVDERADSESVLAHRHRQQQVGFHEPKLAESTVYANNETPDDSIHSQLSSAAATALTAATAATATMPSSSSSSTTLLLQPPTSLGRILNTTQQENTHSATTLNTSHLSDTYFMLQAPKMPRVKEWTVFERLFIRAAVASARSGNSDYGSRSGSEGRSTGENRSHSSDELSTHMAQTDLKYTGVPKGRNGKDLSPVFGGKMYRKTGDAEADKATTDMPREMENLCKEF